MAGCGEQRIQDELAYRTIGLNAMAQGDYEAAIANFQLALNQSVGKIRDLELDICMQKAEALYLNGQAQEAIAVCDSVLEYDKKYANAYYLRGNLYLQQGDTQKGLADYELAAQYAAADYDIYIQLYQNLKRVGMQDAGQVYLDKALKMKGKDRYHLTNQGYIYFLMGDYDKAKEHLAKAVEMEQKGGADDKAELYLAQTCEKQGDEAEAAKYYNAYAASHADDSVVLEEMGNMAMEKGDYINALGYFQKGLQTNRPANKQMLMRGEIAALEYLCKFEEAKDKMAQYVLDYPQDEEAARENLFLKTRTAVADQIAKEEEEARKAEEEAAKQDAEADNGTEGEGGTGFAAEAQN